MSKRNPRRKPAPRRPNGSGKAAPPAGQDPRMEAMARQMGSEYEPNSPTRVKGGRKKLTGGEQVTEKQSREARMWDNRIIRADKRFKAWSDEFDCKHLDDYYEGRQWKGVPEEQAKQKYVINMIFATTETQLPTMMFAAPRVQAEARPDHEFTDGSKAGARATLIEQALQTAVDDPKLKFNWETTMSLRDMYSRFGVVEIGYSADWLDNPHAGRPILGEDGEPMLDPDEDPDDEVFMQEPEKVLAPGSREMLYVRQIPANAYRISPGDPRTESNDWAGYYSWERIADLRSNPDYVNTENLKSTASFWADRDDDYEHEDADEERGSRRGMVRVWRIWDFRERVRIIHAEGHTRLLQKRPFKFFPIADIRMFPRKKTWYPLPPIYNWMSPQDEINETREMQKVHRRRALRRYMRDASVKVEEMEKLETGEDMVTIEVSGLAQMGNDPIRPIADAPLDQQNWSELAATEKDLNTIAGVTGEDRNQPNTPTATQANIINTRSALRESHARDSVAKWLSEVCRLMLLTMRENFKLPFMVKQTVDPFTYAQSPRTAEQAELWREIETEDLDDIDVDVKIDVASLSPVAEDAQRNAWNLVLQLLTNPNLASLLFVPNPNAPDDPSPLLRKTLMLNGVRSDQEIREIWRVGMQIIQQAAQAAQAQAAQSKLPEPVKLTLSLKGEDLMNPQLGPFFMYLIQREEGLAAQASKLGVPTPPMMGDGGGGSAVKPVVGGPGAAGTPTPTVQ